MRYTNRLVIMDRKQSALVEIKKCSTNDYDGKKCIKATKT